MRYAFLNFFLFTWCWISTCPSVAWRRAGIYAARSPFESREDSRRSVSHTAIEIPNRASARHASMASCSSADGFQSRLAMRSRKAARWDIVSAVPYRELCKPHALAGRFIRGLCWPPKQKGPMPVADLDLIPYGPFRAHEDNLLLIVPTIYPAIFRPSSARSGFDAETVHRPYPDHQNQYS